MVYMKRNVYWPKWFGTEMSCYRVLIRGEPVHQEFSVNQSTNNQIWLQHAKETAKYSKKIVVFIFYDVCRVYLPKLLLFSVKIIQVSCFGDYGFSSEVPREGERD